MDKPRILVIDDEQGIREGSKRALSALGYEVDTAENGEQGLEFVQKTVYDLVLLDVMMPGVSGIDLIEKIHEVDVDTVCIIITGYATVEMAVRAIKQGAYDFLTKPFTVDDLRLVVEQGLERRRLTLETKRLQFIELEAKRLEEEKARLEELDRAKMQFIRLVTHELQAPIAAIHTYVKLILEGYVPPEKINETLEKCLGRAEEQMAMIKDLLELGRAQIVDQRASETDIYPDKELYEVVEGLKKQAIEKGLDVRISVQENIPAVKGNADRMRSVWRNLIENAIKYTERGYVEINLKAEGGQIIGEVSDSGIGIPSEDQQHLFQEFFRAKNAKTGHQPGTGLGLVIVKKAIEGMGGNVKVTSQEGKGSSFIFSIPISPR
ncbi:MAG: response regulator [Chloroflexota bacterium]